MNFMAKRFIDNVQLGVFVVAGLAFLVLVLYMIGKNRHLFGSNYLLKAQFENVQGLKAGHNVRYSGIEVGTVKKVTFLNDTLIEVEMSIESKMKSIIRKNAVVSVGTEGFVGNKVLNIVPGRATAPYASEGDLLISRGSVDADEMLRTLSRTNSDIAIVADNLKKTVQNINNSEALWQLLNEKTIPQNIRSSAVNVRLATAKAAGLVDDLHSIVADVKNGKGSLGAILTDSSFAIGLNDAVEKMNNVGTQLDTLSHQLSDFASSLQYHINDGKGIVNALLTDSLMRAKVNESLDHIEKGTDAFNQDMEAMKHSFLLRGYFKKHEKEKQNEKGKNTANAN